MSAAGRARAETFKQDVQRKIERLLAEFADGALNREQFHATYEHYSSQLALADQALQSGDSRMIEKQGGETIHILQARMAKAIGLAIYHNRSGRVLDTLGDFDVPSAATATILNDFTQMMLTDQFIERRVQRVSDHQWLLFVAGRHTTVVTQFEHEPSQRQTREIERLLHDFEVANEAFLSAGRGDANTLAYPFFIFVQKKLTGKA